MLSSRLLGSKTQQVTAKTLLRTRQYVTCISSLQQHNACRDITQWRQDLPGNYGRKRMETSCKHRTDTSVHKKQKLHIVLWTSLLDLHHVSRMAHFLNSVFKFWRWFYTFSFIDVIKNTFGCCSFKTWNNDRHVYLANNKHHASLQ